MPFRTPILVALICSALCQHVSGQEASLREAFSGVGGNAKKRYDWFYQRRAFPADTLQQGMLWNALRRVLDYPSSRTTTMVWESIGPQPGTYLQTMLISGRAPALTLHPNDVSTVYLGAADGGVWKTTNGGTTWIPKTDALSCLATGSLKIDIHHPETVYWGTGEPYYASDAYGGAGIFKSTDGGSTWQSVGLTQEKRICQIALEGSSLVFAATWGGIYRSSNAGATWTRTLALGYGYDVIADEGSGLIYAAIGDNASGAGVYKSTDLGVTWVKLGGGLPSSGVINRIKLDGGGNPSGPWMLYALMSSRSPLGGLLGLYKTTDYGQTWTNPPAPTNLFGPNNQGWYDMSLGVARWDARVVYVGGFDLYRSQDGGLTWTPMNGNGAIHFDQHAIALETWTLDRGYIANDGGVWKTTDRGMSWVNLNSSLSITQCYSIGLDRMTPSRIYAGTQDNGTQRTTSPPGWSGVLPGDGGMVAVDPGRSDIVYAEHQNGMLYRSNDSGNTFQPLYTVGGAWVTPLRLHPVYPTTVFSANRQVLRSTDSGLHWSPISGNLNGNLAVDWLAIDPVSPSTIYASSMNSVFRTTDGGGQWMNVSAGLPTLQVTQVVVDPNAPGVVYATCSGSGPSHVFRSTQRGNTWSDISGDLPPIAANALLVEPGNSAHLYLGTDIGLFISSNGGTTWLKETGIPSSAVIDLALTSDSYLIAATHGRGMYRTPIVTPQTVVLQIPDGGEVWARDTVQDIHWASNNLPGTVRIEMSRDGGVSFPETLFAETANDGVESWVATGPTTYHARIRVSGVFVPAACDTSGTDVAVLRRIHEELPGGWNLVSLSVAVTDRASSSVFPASISPAYTFSDQIYTLRDSLRTGEGYWIKFPPGQSMDVWGLDRGEDTLAVVGGWNMIGTVSHPVVADAIIQEPPGIVVSSFFGYTGTYGAADTLRPGRGYWVKTSQPGRLVIR